MAIIVDASGTQTATISTEHSLATVSVAGEYELKVDIDALAAGATPDIIELRVKTNILTGGTERVERIATYVGGLKELNQ